MYEYSKVMFIESDVLLKLYLFEKDVMQCIESAMSIVQQLNIKKIKVTTELSFGFFHFTNLFFFVRLDECTRSTFQTRAIIINLNSDNSC